MPLLTRMRSACRLLFRPAQVERDLDDELRFALDVLTARHAAKGLAPDAAARAARLELGRVDNIKEDARARGLAHALETTWRDIVAAWRSTARTPLESTLLVLVIAGGIGAASAIFSVVNALLLAPLPYRSADRLVFVWQDLTSAGYPRAPLAGPELQDLRDRSTLFDGFGGIWANTAALTDGAEPEQLRVGLVTPDFFDVLGADALLGRTFKPGDDGQDTTPGILLSHALWTRRYGGNPALVGQRVLVSGRPATVVGVMPDTFRLLLPADSAIPDDQQAWLLLNRDAVRGPRVQQFLRVVGRLKTGVSLADGQREIAAIAQQVGREFTNYGPQGATFYGVGLQADATREMRPALLALFGAVCLLLTIGCVNVAGLLVTRAAGRHHETAVRLAIGASRGRLFRQCLVEGLLLSLLGGAGGMLLGQGMLSLLIAARPASLSRIDLTQMDLRVLAFAAAVSILWGVLFSLAPFAQVLGTSVSRALHGAARGTVGGSGYRVRAGLLVAQVAISSVLLVTAGLLAKGFYELQQVQAGFSADAVLTFKVSLSGARYGGPDPRSAFSRQLRERLAAIPGVSAAGAISHLPYDTVPNWGTPYLTEPRIEAMDGLADARAVTPGYFEAVGAQLLEGRWFAEADTLRAPRVAIVDTRLAARLWPGERAIGRVLKADPGTTGTPSVPVTIVGVVRHIRHRDVTRELREQMYFPAQQSLRNPMAYAVKTSGAPAEVVPAIRAALARIDPALPIYDVRPLDSYTGDALAIRTFTVVLALAFAASALVLVTIGIYGVIAFAAAQRRREFGLRLALGARAGQVTALVLKDGLRLALGGAALGTVGAAYAAHLIRTELQSVSPAYPLAYVVGVGAVLGAALLASWIPAHRAARTSPLESLRGE